MISAVFLIAAIDNFCFVFLFILELRRATNSSENERKQMVWENHLYKALIYTQYEVT